MRRLFLVGGLALAFGCASSAPTAPVQASTPLACIALAENGRDLSTVLPYLTDADPSVRARAARAVGRIGDRSAIPSLRAAALDKDAAVSTEAIFAWGLLGGDGLDDRARVQSILDHSDGPGKQALAFALGNAGKAECGVLLFEQFTDVKDPEVLGTASLASAKYLSDRFKTDYADFAPRSESWLVNIASAARSESYVKLRWKIVYALAASSRLLTSDLLLSFAEDPDALVRLFVARGLAKRPDTSTWTDADAARAYSRDPRPLTWIQSASREVDAALVRLAGDLDARVACEVAIAVKSPNSRALFGAFANNLDRPEVFLRRAAVRALSRGRASQVLDIVMPALDKAAKDANPWVRAETAVAYAEIRTPNAVDLVNLAARDPNPFVRARAAEAAGSLPLESAKPILASCSSDLDARVATAVAAALVKFRDPASNALLRSLLADERGIVRETAAESLQARGLHSPDLLGDSNALVNSLISARGPDLSEPRATLLVALTEIESLRRASNRSIAIPGESQLRGQVRQAILECYADPDPSVRAKARAAWKALYTDEAPPGVKSPEPLTPAIAGVNISAFTRQPRVRLVTSRGPLVIGLFHLDAPVHAENFLRLAERQAYDNTAWHRVEFNFVVQGGDPLGDGTGGSAATGGTIRDEINRVEYVRGTVGMPKTDVPDSGGGQLFVSLIPTPHLNGRYTAFGQVIEGLEILDLLEVGDRIEQIQILDRGRD